MNTLAYILEKIKYINNKYDEIDKINGVQFNIFSILDMERKEVKTHSNFIYELLNPKGSHNQGDIYLNLFFKSVLDLDYDISSVCQVVQEDTTSEKRRIDFTLETSKYQIGIEMKIDYKDGKSQLFDYFYELKRRLKKEQSAKLFYLTLDGKEPNDISISKSDKKLKSRDYKLISFNQDIIKWLEECIKESATNTTIREALIQYLNLVNKITNKSNSKGRKKAMNDLLFNSENLKVYLEAQNYVVDAKIELQCRFWDVLIKKLDASNLYFEFKDAYQSKNIREAVKKYYIQKKNNRGYEYILDLDEKEDLCISITLENYVYYAVVSRKDNSTYFDKIKSIKEWDDFKENYCDDYTSEKLNFNDLLDTPIVLQFFDDKILNKIVDEIVNELQDIKQQIDKIIKQT